MAESPWRWVVLAGFGFNFAVNAAMFMNFCTVSELAEHVFKTDANGVAWLYAERPQPTPFQRRTGAPDEGGKRRD